MKKFLILSLLVLVSGFYTTDAFAQSEEYKVVLIAGATDSSHQCAEDNTCLIPNILYVENGAEVTFLIDQPNGATAFCWGTLESGCTGSGKPPFSYGGKSMSFSENGIYDYVDVAHPWYSGRIVVGLENPPEQDLSEIKEQQESSSQVFLDEQEKKDIQRFESSISQLKEMILELNEDISKLEIKILQLETGEDNPKYESGKYLEPEKDLEHFRNMIDLKESEQLELYRDELEKHRQYLHELITDLEFKILQLETNLDSENRVEQEPEQNTEVDNTRKEKSDELGIASFVDKSKDPQHYIDRYNKEPSYREWFHENYPQYDSIEQAVGLELTEKIPDWVKNIFGWYANDQVSEDELLNAIKYLINEGILIVE